MAITINLEYFEFLLKHFKVGIWLFFLKSDLFAQVLWWNYFKNMLGWAKNEIFQKVSCTLTKAIFLFLDSFDGIGNLLNLSLPVRKWEGKKE